MKVCIRNAMLKLHEFQFTLKPSERITYLSWVFAVYNHVTALWPPHNIHNYILLRYILCNFEQTLGTWCGGILYSHRHYLFLFSVTRKRFVYVTVSSYPSVNLFLYPEQRKKYPWNLILSWGLKRRQSHDFSSQLCLKNTLTTRNEIELNQVPVKIYM
jgi:hypothetical protein